MTDVEKVTQEGWDMIVERETRDELDALIAEEGGIGKLPMIVEQMRAEQEGIRAGAELEIARIQRKIDLALVDMRAYAERFRAALGGAPLDDAEALREKRLREAPKVTGGSEATGKARKPPGRPVRPPAPATREEALERLRAALVKPGKVATLYQRTGIPEADLPPMLKELGAVVAPNMKWSLPVAQGPVEAM